MRAILYISVVILSLTSSVSFAQDTLVAKVEVIGRAQPDHILLRWSPNTPMAWYYSNKYGMKLERYTILRDGKVLDVPEKKSFSAVFKPLPLEQWEAIAAEDEYALVAAQAIYGESFEVTENFSSDISSAINQTKEMEQRHWFAMVAADQSRKVAQASGLLYEDRDVKKNEKYLYTISSRAPRETMRIDTGHVYLGLEDYFELPSPEGLQAKVDGSMVMLRWEGRRFQDLYNSFIVERSDDGGKTFQSITDLPVVNPLQEDGEYPEYIVKGDTIRQFNKKYFYRIKGINPFGEVSPPSDTVSAITYPTLNYTPRIVSWKARTDGSMFIQWHFPREAVDSIQGFKLKRASKVKGDFTEIVSALLPTDTTTIDPAPLNSNYYVVVAYDKYGNEASSIPSLAMLEDSIPPGPPVNLIGKIDSAGIVTLNWDKNAEPDLLGYRVYRSSFSTREFIQITVSHVSEPVFTDTIEIKTLTRNVFYKITAVDTRFNPSDFSAVLQLERPDIVPPAPPQFESINAGDKGIRLRWISSSSEDVEKHVLYRRASAEAGWTPIFITHAFDSVSSFTDTLSTPGEMYAYTLIAVDRGGLESVPSKPVSRRRPIRVKQVEIKNVAAAADRKDKMINLSWDYRVEGVSKYLIYKARENEQLVLYKEIGSEEQVFQDAELKTNTVYKYRLQAEFENGALSPFSKEIIVNY